MRGPTFIYVGFAQLKEPTSGWAFLFLLELILELAFNFFLVERLQHLFELGIMGDVDTHSFQDFGQDFEDLCILLFGNGVDLQSHLLPQTVDPFLSVLGNENKDRQNDGFQRNRCGQKDVGEWVKRFYPGYYPRIEHQPGPKPGNIEKEELGRPEDCGDPIFQPLYPGAAGSQLGLDTLNGGLDYLLANTLVGHLRGILAILGAMTWEEVAGPGGVEPPKLALEASGLPLAYGPKSSSLYGACTSAPSDRTS